MGDLHTANAARAFADHGLEGVVAYVQKHALDITADGGKTLFAVMNCLPLSDRGMLARICWRWAAFYRDFAPKRMIIRPDSTVRCVPRVGEHSSICFIRSGNFLVTTCPPPSGVIEYTRNGDEVRRFGEGILRAPSTAQYDAVADEIVVADMRTNRLSVFGGAGGGFLRHLGAEAGFDFISGMAMMPPRRILVADHGNHRVVVLSLDDGSVIASLGYDGPGDGELYRPESVAFDPTSNRIFVCEYGNRRVSVFDAVTMCFVATFGHGHLHRPGQMLVDDIGQIAVAEERNKCICIFARDFSFVRSIPSGGARNIAFDGDGELFAILP